MSRVEELRAKYEAELAVAELEDRLVAMKADPDADPGELRDLKLQLREARRKFRTLRAGDAAVNPATVEATTSVEKG